MTDFAAVRDYLAAPRCAVLSTLDVHGAPHQTVVHYFCEEDFLVVITAYSKFFYSHLY